MSESGGRRTCIVLLTGVGDVVHGLPVVNALKRSGYATHITWVAERVPSRVVWPHAAVDDVVVFNKEQGIGGVRALRRELAAREFDLTLNLNVYFKSVWPTWFSRAPRRLGFDQARSHDGVWLFSNEHLPPRPRAHTQDMFLEFLQVLQVAAEPVEWRIEFTAAERQVQAAFFQRFAGQRTVGVVPASANPKKDWLPDRYARVIDALSAEYNAQVVMIGGPSAREREITAIIQRESRAKVVNGLGDNVRRMMWLIAGCDLIIAPDTGPVHIARALDVPVIGLYGHTNPWRVGPYRKYHDLWIDRYTEADEAPDPANMTPKPGRMERIEVNAVLARVNHAFRTYISTDVT